jgi:ubiquinone/menaquinone biosynthesis C-methylase UbiE
MVNIQNLKSYLGMGKIKPDKEASEAYDLWASQYDLQPGNLMLQLDLDVFHQLIEKLDLKNKTIIDIGCGTGRHWPHILDKEPSQLVGYDVSNGMLSELKKKFPQAETQLVTDDLLTGVRDDSVDLLISTLTIAHIRNIEAVIKAWSRVLKKGGHILLTDFHPRVLEAGGKRDFTIGGKHVTIKNHIYPVEKIISIAAMNQLYPMIHIERFIDERVRHFYHDHNALHVYEKFKGLPIIYGLNLEKR